MKFHQRLMRIISPACERHRAEYRQALARSQAHAEDLTRTCILHGFHQEKDYFQGASATYPDKVEVLDLWSGDSKAERSTLRKVVGAAVLVLAIGLILAGLSGCASVPEARPAIARQGANYVRLTQEPCTLKGFMRGDAVLDGQHFQLCWRAMLRPQPHVLAIFDDGDVWRMNPAAFHEEQPI